MKYSLNFYSKETQSLFSYAIYKNLKLSSSVICLLFFCFLLKSKSCERRNLTYSTHHCISNLEECLGNNRHSKMMKKCFYIYWSFVFIHCARDWNMFPCLIEALTFNEMVIGEGAFGKWLGLHSLWRWGPCDGIHALIRKERNRALSAMWGHSEKMFVYKPGRELFPEIYHHGTLILNF